MCTIHGTKKLLDPVKKPIAPAVEHPTTALGNWYATAIFWRPQATFLVNAAFVASERWAMSDASFSKTANRSVLGVMNRLEFELDHVRDRVGQDLQDLSLWMSDRLVGPLRRTEFRTPQEKLMEIVHAQA